MVELMNAIETDVAVVGNHEYDFGPEAAARGFAASAFPWLGTNVIGADGAPAEGLVASHIVERGGFKVGFFGLVTPETAILSSPGGEIAFAPVIETARQAVEALEAQGAELIVALTHQFISDDRKLAAEVEGIHLVLGGHDHVPIATDVEGTAILKSSHNARYLAVADLHVERVERDGRDVALGATGMAPVEHRRYRSRKPEIQALVDAHGATSRRRAERRSSAGPEVELDSRRSSVRSRETNFGNLIAEAMRRGVGAEVGHHQRRRHPWRPHLRRRRRAHAPGRLRGAPLRQRDGPAGARRRRTSRRARERRLAGREPGRPLPADCRNEPRLRPAGLRRVQPGGGGRGRQAQRSICLGSTR